MSTLWTPDGEHQVPRERPGAPPAASGGARPASEAVPRRPDEPGGSRADQPGGAAASFEAGEVDAAEREALAAHIAELREQLATTPAAVVIANHAYGLFELAALHLSAQPPNLEEGQLAVDALGALVEGLSGRLDEAEPSLREALTQIRLAFVQIAGVGTAAGNGEAPSDP